MPHLITRDPNPPNPNHPNPTPTGLKLWALCLSPDLYSGVLYDLLNSKKKLFAREDASKVTNIVGVPRPRACQG